MHPLHPNPPNQNHQKPTHPLPHRPNHYNCVGKSLLNRNTFLGSHFFFNPTKRGNFLSPYFCLNFSSPCA